MTQPTHDQGNIHIASEVISVIAGLASTEITGVKGMAGGLAGGLAELLGKKSPAKGVKVEADDKEASIDLYLTLEYGSIIPLVAKQVQNNVKKAIEGMTGLKVVEVNVHVTGIDIPRSKKEDEGGEDEKKEKGKELQEPNKGG